MPFFIESEIFHEQEGLPHLLHENLDLGDPKVDTKDCTASLPSHRSLTAQPKGCNSLFQRRMILICLIPLASLGQVKGNFFPPRIDDSTRQHS